MRGFLGLLMGLAWACSAHADPAALRAVNEFRAGAQRAPLRYSERLETAAAVHARDMLEASFFDHRGSDGSDVAQRVSRVGYSWCYVAENIALGQRDLSAVMAAWSASPGHRRNLLSPQVRDFALVQGAGRIWVMVLAAPGC